MSMLGGLSSPGESPLVVGGKQGIEAGWGPPGKSSQPNTCGYADSGTDFK